MTLKLPPTFSGLLLLALSFAAMEGYAGATELGLFRRELQARQSNFSEGTSMAEPTDLFFDRVRYHGLFSAAVPVDDIWVNVAAENAPCPSGARFSSLASIERGRNEQRRPVVFETAREN